MCVCVCVCVCVESLMLNLKSICVLSNSVISDSFWPHGL